MLRIGILTVSDRSATGERSDVSGPAILKVIEAHGWQVVEHAVVADEYAQIVQLLSEWSDSGRMDILLTTGGTGLSPRDVTPEATLAVIDRAVPGLAEAMRSASLQVTPHAMISRSVAGVRKRTLIINLPGSPKGAVENLQTVLPVFEHAGQLLQEDPGAEAGHHFNHRPKE